MMKIASLLQFTLPGVPSIYYGDEIGMQGMKDPFNRACMAWDKPNEELFKWYKRLGEIRRGTKAFEKGEFIPVFCGYKTVAFKRSDEKSEVLVAVNLDDEAVAFNIGDEWRNSYCLLGESPQGDSLNLAPYRYSMITRVK